MVRLSGNGSGTARVGAGVVTGLKRNGAGPVAAPAAMVGGHKWGPTVAAGASSSCVANAGSTANNDGHCGSG